MKKNSIRLLESFVWETWRVSNKLRTFWREDDGRQAAMVMCREVRWWHDQAQPCEPAIMVQRRGGALCPVSLLPISISVMVIVPGLLLVLPLIPGLSPGARSCRMWFVLRWVSVLEVGPGRELIMQQWHRRHLSLPHWPDLVHLKRLAIHTLATSESAA